MRWTLIPTAIAAAAILSTPALSQREEGVTVFHLTLEGEQEAPVLGDLDGTGTAILRVHPDRERVCYTIKVSGIAPVTAAHIHLAPAGTAGGVVIPLNPPTGVGCATASRTLLLDIIANPEDYYLNVHNAEFPGGALRDQLG